MAMDTDPSVVIAGLDPAIHPLRKKGLTKMIDPRVKPAGDVPVGPFEMAAQTSSRH
jgi:hypothetical protein